MYLKSRADYNGKFYLFNNTTGQTTLFAGTPLGMLETYLTNGVKSSFVERLIDNGILPTSLGDDNVKEIIHNINESRKFASSGIHYRAPEAIHIDVTSVCPFECKLCYRAECGDKTLDFEKLEQYIVEAGVLNVFQIAFGGGEPLTYPHIYDAVSLVDQFNMSASITTSGYGLDEQVLKKLISSGLRHMQVSLNGSTAEVNSATRDGFEHAMSALKLLSNSSISFGINWVAHESNVHDFHKIVELGKELNVENLNVLRFKTNKAEFDVEKLAKEIEEHRTDINIKVDSAYSNLLFYLNGDDYDEEKIGCGAGRTFMSIDVDGIFKPCSHLPMGEKCDSISAYWHTSEDIKILRDASKNLKGDCETCKYKHDCRGCLAISKKLHDDYHAGERDCIAKDEEVI